MSDSNFYFENDEIKECIPNRIIYTGCLAQVEPKPEYIFMHFGYGITWDNLQEIKLKRYYDNYEADIDFDESGTLYFCFRTADNNWDNNFGNNYQINVLNNDLYNFYSTAVPMEIPDKKSIYLVKRKLKLAFHKLIKFLGKIFRRNIKRKNIIKEDIYE